MRLSEKIALVTGSANGIGRAIDYALTEEGACGERRVDDAMKGRDYCQFPLFSKEGG